MVFGKLRVPQPLRFKLMVGAALVILAMGNGLALKQIQTKTYNDCVDRARSAAATAPALRKLVDAHRLDHDPHAEQVWQQFLDARKKNPPQKEEDC